MAMLPDPNFISRFFCSEEEASGWIDKQPEPDLLIAYEDKPNKGWRVTTKANFESSEYWRGRPQELNTDEL